MEHPNWLSPRRKTTEDLEGESYILMADPEEEKK